MEIEQAEECCCHCKITFWITKEHQKELHRCHNTFWCPNGHPQSYMGKSNAQKYKEEKERNEQLSQGNDAMVRSNAALRGVITKMKKKPK